MLVIIQLLRGKQKLSFVGSMSKIKMFCDLNEIFSNIIVIQHNFEEKIILYRNVKMMFAK